MPGTKTSEKSWKTRSRSANEMETYKQLTEQARAFPQLQRGRPSATVRACANESLPSRAEGAALPIQPHQAMERPPRAHGHGGLHCRRESDTRGIDRYCGTVTRSR